MKIILLLFFSLFLVADAANAIGVGVAPSELNFNIQKGKIQQKELTVYNLEDTETEFEVRSNADYLEFYHSGIIAAASSEKIIVEADASNLKEGTYEEDIYITMTHGASGVRLNLGTVIKTRITIFTIDRTNLLVGIMTSISIVVMGLLIYLTNMLNKIVAFARKLLVKALSLFALLAVKP